MAGRYLTILNPGYSGVYVRDLPYLAGSGEDAAINPFKPTDDRPLVEGEWLQFGASANAPRFTRGGDNVTSVSGTPDNEGTVPAFPYFMEEGRIDAQVAGMAHCIVGPLGYEFRTKLCYSGGGLAVGDKVSVWDWDGRSGAYGVTRRVLAKWSAGWVVGRVTRIWGTDDISVIFGLQ